MRNYISTTESPQTDPCVYGNLIYDKTGIAYISMREDGFFPKKSTEILGHLQKKK